MRVLVFLLVMFFGGATPRFWPAVGFMGVFVSLIGIAIGLAHGDAGTTTIFGLLAAASLALLIYLAYRNDDRRADWY